MSEQDVPSRRQVWIVRLVFYPLAIGLIAIAWHQRQARAGEDGAARPVVRAVLSGTAGIDRATADLADGRLRDLRLPLHFRCVPELGDVWAVFQRFEVAPGGDAGGDDGRVRARVTQGDTTWPSGWFGVADVAVDGRLRDGRLRGTASGRLTLDANGVRAECRAAAVPVALGR